MDNIAKGLKRDDKNNAVLSVDNLSFESYKSMRDKSQRINTLSTEVNELKSELREIKDLLYKLVDRK